MEEYEKIITDELMQDMKQGWAHHICGVQNMTSRPLSEGLKLYPNDSLEDLKKKGYEGKDMVFAMRAIYK